MRKKRVLHLYKAMIPSVLLCGHCQMESLAAQGLIEYQHYPANRVRKTVLDWAEIVVLCRLDNTYERRLTQLLKKSGKCIVYVMDDDLLNVPVEMSSGAYYAQPEIQANIRSMIAMSDAVISPSPLLLEKYAANTQKRILLEEPAIDPVPYTPHDPERPVRIGFAGSIDRAGDIEVILRDALLRIKDEYGQRVEFTFYGAIPSFAEELGAACVPYSASYDNYRKTMNALQLDIGLAPMPDTPFHACKHYNKFIEYAAANAVGIFSAVRPYNRLKGLWQWELLCGNTAESWYGMIRELLDQPEKLDALKEKVAMLAETQFSVPVIAQALGNELCSLPVNQVHKKICSIALGVIRAEALIKRLLNGLKRNGIHGSIMVICRKLSKAVK